MAIPVLFDAVTLRHLSVCGHLSTCQVIHGARPLPRWTGEVKHEIELAASLGFAGCGAILSQTWLGAPQTPSLTDLVGIVRLQIALNGGGHSLTDNGGEAESIYYAQLLGGIFATDDNAAYAFAARRLGAVRVIDTVDILRSGVAAGALTSADALKAATDIRAVGRHLRRVHPDTLSDAYFQ